MNGATSASPDNRAFDESAARSETCWLFASSTAAPSSQRAAARPCRNAIASTCVFEPRTITRVNDEVRLASNDNRSVDSFARWRWPPTPNVEPAMSATIATNFNTRELGSQMTFINGPSRDRERRQSNPNATCRTLADIACKCLIEKELRKSGRMQICGVCLEALC